jgi:hypothetical protein
MAACCKKCERLGTCCEGLGQGEPEHTTKARDSMFLLLALGAWWCFNELGKFQKGKKSILDKWIKR